MSTKIYDAYRFPRSLSIKDLTDAVFLAKPKVLNEAYVLYLQRSIRTFVEAYDCIAIRGEEWCNEIIAKLKAEAEDKADFCKDKALFYEAMRDKDYSGAVFYLDDMAWEMKRLSKIYPIAGDYSSKLTVIPVGKQLLAMTFGNPCLNTVLVDTIGLEDYHYQNQTDRPEEISAQAWNTRERTWDKAIGPDYIPSNHGFTFDIVHPDEVDIFNIRARKNYRHLLKKENLKKCIPDSDARVKRVVDTYSDCPNLNEVTPKLSDESNVLSILTEVLR